MFENLFFGLHGASLVAACIASLTVIACGIALIHELYLFADRFVRNVRYQKWLVTRDEFVDRDDPFAVVLPYPTMIDGVRIVYFQSFNSMYDWAQKNIPSVFKRAQFTLETQHLWEYNDRKGFLMGMIEPSTMEHDELI